MMTTTRMKKKAAALLLLMGLEQKEKRAQQVYTVSSFDNPPFEFYMLYSLLLWDRARAKRKRQRRSMWVRTWLTHERRQKYGHYGTLLNELKTEDEKAFFNYTRLPLGLYNEVLGRIEKRIQKKETWFRKPLSPGLRLSLTLRHLACGDSYPSLAYNFRVAPNTVSLIVQEVCDAIKAEYATEVIQCPTMTDEWAAIAHQFESIWQFPHCCGALDGKHVAVTCPWNSGSLYRNYKGFFSVVLMGLVDADYKFLWIDVGSEGSNNDASIYNGSELKEGLESKKNIYNLPEDQPLPGDDVPVPYFILGDNAFGINNHLMNPFSLRNMEYHERIFNYRLSRARRVVENAFGILVQKFRVLLKTMNQRPETCRKIITTCVILHNLIRIRYPATHANLMDTEDQSQNFKPGGWRDDKVLLDVLHERARNAGTQEGRQIKRYLGHYFSSCAGSVPWQDKMIL